MVEIGIGTNEQGQRLDRFLRKYLPEAPLSLIYKMIRKDVKVNGRRRDNVYMLENGDVITLYLDQDHVDELRGRRSDASMLAGGGSASGSKAVGASTSKPRKTFRIAYEDGDVLIADKPAGLLTHGDSTEKSKHLANQVQDYLIEKGEYVPRAEKTFAPSPVNRIDRNTSGLVIFAKNYDALKRLNEYIRGREKIRKIYLTIVCGRIDSEMTLSGMITKDEDRNVSTMRDDAESKSRTAVTFVRPLKHGTIEGMGGMELTVAEVEIETGRTHQIRVQLADAGYPLAGDPKYGDPKVNRKLREKFGLTHQLLTAARLEFGDMDDYPALDGKTVEARLPKVFIKVRNSIKTAE
jgi:23S rRNA pseudouridine955/2504/2580 synthase